VANTIPWAKTIPWCALALPTVAAAIVAQWGWGQYQHTQTQQAAQHHAVAMALQLDGLSARLHDEQLAASMGDRINWRKARSATRTTWAQVQAASTPADNAMLAPIKASLSHIYWADQKTAAPTPDATTPEFIDPAPYIPLQAQLEQLGMTWAHNHSMAQTLRQLRSLHQATRRLSTQLRTLLTGANPLPTPGLWGEMALTPRPSNTPTSNLYTMDGASADNNPVAQADTLLANTQAPDITQAITTTQTEINGLIRWVSPHLTDRQYGLFNQLFNTVWQPLQPKLGGIVGNPTANNPQIPKAIQQLDAITDALDSLLNDTQDTLQTDLTLAQQAQTSTWWQLLAVALGLPVLGGCILGVYQQRLNQRLRHALVWANTLTCGNLTAQPHSSLLGADVLGQMAMAMDECRHQWRRTLVTIKTQSDVLQAAVATGLCTPEQTPATEPNDPMNEALPAHNEETNPLFALPDNWEQTLTHALAQLTTANQGMHTMLTHWEQDHGALTQQMTELAEPLQTGLTQVENLVQQASGLTQWVETLQAYSQQGQALIQRARHTIHRINHEVDPQDNEAIQEVSPVSTEVLDQLQTEATELQQTISQFCQLVKEELPMLVTTWQASHTQVKPTSTASTNVWTALQQTLGQYTF
jgi:methyl-accepting chemotaxis protein